MSQTIRYPRGSEWRRWDLHVHTPHSALNNGFGDDFDSYARQLLERAVAEEIAVVGVTDYFGVPGYAELRALLADDDRLVKLVGEEVAAAAGEILFLPNIELRARELVPSGNEDSRVNFHVILSDELSIETIEEHLLRELKFTDRSRPGGLDEERSLTKANLEELGRRLKVEHEAFRGQSDLVIGMMNAVVTHEAVTKVLETDRFRSRYLFVVPADEDLSSVSWNGQGHQTRKLFVQKAHMLFSSNANTREWALGRKHSSVKDFEIEFRTRKPCIHGSDAHSYVELFAPALDRMLWIKADPTFQGLRQLLHEPAERVFIGDRPPSIRHVAENSTRYLSSLTLERTPQAIATERWFSGEVPLNHGLIAVIGRKGSGKSAFADILGLLGDSRQSAHFSFLRKKPLPQCEGRPRDHVPGHSPVGIWARREPVVGSLHQSGKSGTR